MDETQLDEEVDLEESNELDEGSDEQSQDSSEEDKQPRKPNLVKQLRNELKEAKRLLKEREAKSEVKLSADQELESRFFFVENPEAKELKAELRATIAKFPNMSMDEAYAYVKATAPKQSETKQDFNLRTRSKPANVLDMEDDEAAEKLSPSEYLKYTRAKGSPFLKSGIGRK
jgi:hypothetical protein